MTLLSQTLSRLLDTHAKIERVMAGYAVLARQSERIGGLLKRYPQIRIDWLDYAVHMRQAEREIDEALKDEAELKTLFSAWVEKNFTGHEAQQVRVNLEALGITQLSGVEIPLAALVNLGDGSLATLISRTLSLSSRVRGTEQLIRDLESTQLATLEEVREVLKSHGEAYARAVSDLSGLIAERRPVLAPRGISPEIVLLGLIGLWGLLKLRRYLTRRAEERHA